MAKAALAVRRREIGPPEFFPEIEQGSREWLDLRLGIPTASCFSMVVRDADAKTRQGYMDRLAGELMSGFPAEPSKQFVTAAMERGKEWEPEARDEYEQTKFESVERVGFVRRMLPTGRYVGCSPDGLLGKRKKAVEIKTMASHRLVSYVRRGATMLPEHRWQIHGTIWLCDLDEADLMIYSRGMWSPIVKVRRDETICKEISDAVEVFDHELNRLVTDLRAKGRPFR